MIKKNGNKKNISALLVSYNPLVIKGIAGQIKNLSKVDLIIKASNKIEMMLRIQKHNPTLVIISNDRNDQEEIDPLEIIRLALSEFPSIKILLIIDKRDFKLELDALKIGVRGVITGNFNREEIAKCISTMANGGLWFRREVMEQYITDQQFINKNKSNKTTSVPSFTKRELEIIQLVVNGQKNREIGNQLYISEKTVKHHLTKIFRKLKINKRVQLKGLI